MNKNIRSKLNYSRIQNEDVEKRPLNHAMKAVFHSVLFDASILASGVYLYRLTADDFVQTRRMVLLK